MPNAKILPLVCVGCALAALAANHLVARVGAVMHGKRLSIDAFPRTVGAWKAGPDLPPPDAETVKIIPTAHVVDRGYTRGDGVKIDLTLVTATEFKDLHDPAICLPGSGWDLGKKSSCRIGDDLANSAVGTQKNGDGIEVLYWWTASVLRRDSATQGFRAIRSLAIGTQGNSLLVRLITKKTPNSRQLLQDFARDIEKPLQALKEEAQKG